LFNRYNNRYRNQFLINQKSKEKDKKGVRENHSHILLAAVAYAPLLKQQNII
jgi:hypothetical protein